MSRQSKIRLLLADDHDLVRSELKSMLEGEGQVPRHLTGDLTNKQTDPRPRGAMAR